jgi:hypothetical protein
MAHKKIKSDIKSKLILKDGIQEYTDWWNFWDYDDDYYYQCDGCGSYHCCGDCSSYEYLPDEQQPKTIDYISKRGIRVTTHTYSFGKLIDMSTIYSKEIMRQKKLEAILGGQYEVFYKKSYFKDLLDEKSGNILGKLD